MTLNSPTILVIKLEDILGWKVLTVLFPLGRDFDGGETRPQPIGDHLHRARKGDLDAVHDQSSRRQPLGDCSVNDLLAVVELNNDAREIHFS